MLEKVRKPGRAKSFIAYAIFGAICLVFVFFGLVPNEMGLQSGGSAAVVNNSLISLADFRNQVQNLEARYKMQLDQVPEPQRNLELAKLRQRALENLIAVELISQEAMDAGLKVSDAQVRDSITSIEAFHQDGRFQRSLYQNYLQGTRTTASRFEDRMRKDLIFGRMQNVFAMATKPLPIEMERREAARQTELNLEFVEVDPLSLQAQLEPSDKEVQEFLASEESQKKVQEYYEANKDEFTQKEQVRARHILLTFEKDNKASEEEALKKITELKEKATAENFGKLAAEHSEDPVSKKEQGDLGYFGRGRMVPAFEKTAFELPVGQISEPVKSEFGYHLIKVEDKKAEETQPLEKVQAQIAKRMLSETQADQLVTQLKELVQKGNAEELQQFLAKHGLKWQETGRFDLSREVVPKIGESDKLLSLAVQAGEGKLVPELVSARGKDFAVRVKTLKTGVDKGEKPQVPPSVAMDPERFEREMLSMQRAGEAFQTWYNSAQKQADITRNSTLLSTN